MEQIKQTAVPEGRFDPRGRVRSTAMKLSTYSWRLLIVTLRVLLISKVLRAGARARARSRYQSAC